MWVCVCVCVCACMCAFTLTIVQWLDSHILDANSKVVLNPDNQTNPSLNKKNKYGELTTRKTFAALEGLKLHQCLKWSKAAGSKKVQSIANWNLSKDDQLGSEASSDAIAAHFPHVSHAATRWWPLTSMQERTRWTNHSRQDESPWLTRDKSNGSWHVSHVKSVGRNERSVAFVAHARFIHAQRCQMTDTLLQGHN